MYKRVIYLSCAILSIAFFVIFQPPGAFAGAPDSAPRLSPDTGCNSSSDVLPSLLDFINGVIDPHTDTITGVYICRVLALKVTQQPDNNPVYVSTDLGVATQFRLAANYGTIGLLAHNDKSGSEFFNLQMGEEVDVVYGNGMIRRYAISSIRHFQALKPDDPYSDFNDLDSGATRLSSTTVFQQIFSMGDQVVLQTCIDANGNPTWGRLFVIARPIPVN